MRSRIEEACSVLFWLCCAGVTLSVSRQSLAEFTLVGFGCDFAVEAGVQEFVKDVSELRGGFQAHGFEAAPDEHIKSILMPDHMLRTVRLR